MVMLHIKLKGKKYNNMLTCAYADYIYNNLFVVHFSIECNISELYILRNSWCLARPIMSFSKDKEYDRILNFSLIDPLPQIYI